MITYKVVKVKRLQFMGNSLGVILPSEWCKEFKLSKESHVVLEYIPFQKKIIVNLKEEKENEKENEKEEEEISDIVQI